jgi:hypothetical protein
MIDFIETNVEFILEFLHVPFPLDRESFWPRNSTHPVTRPNAVRILYLDMKVKKDYQVLISPLLQSMLGFRQAIVPGGSMFQIG